MKSRQESGKIASEAVIFKYEISEGVWRGLQTWLTNTLNLNQVVESPFVPMGSLNS